MAAQFNAMISILQNEKCVGGARLNHGAHGPCGFHGGDRAFNSVIPRFHTVIPAKAQWH